jgi:hypothetical protein
MGDIHLPAPRSVTDYYKLFSQACIESIHNYYGCYGLSEIVMNQDSVIDIYYNDPYIEIYCKKDWYSPQWGITIHKYE